MSKDSFPKKKNKKKKNGRRWSFWRGVTVSNEVEIRFNFGYLEKV